MAKFIPRAVDELQRMTEQRDELVTALRACEALTAKRRDEITSHEIMAVRRIILAALAGVMSQGELKISLHAETL